ncbi:MAG: ABC transporter permease, partial [Chloroflexi bacterium]|nr:ABC transporter permease [Chloroflexota bacterium]
LAVAGADRAPNLVAFFRYQAAQIREAPPDPETAVRRGDHDVVLVIPESFPADFQAGRPATVQLVVDSSRQSSEIAARRTRDVLDAYGRSIGVLRVLARGLSPSVTQSLIVDRNDVATPQSQAARLLNMLPYFVIFAVFIGGLYVAIDTTAGERERGSLEPLIINPVARSELVVAKLGVTFLFTLVGVVETLAGFWAITNVASLQHLGIQLSLAPGALVGIFLICLPMVFLAGALQLLIGISTRSFKEAQNYLYALPLVPAVPGLFLTFVPVKTDLWMMFVPTLGQQLLINQVLRGEPLDLPYALVSAAATLALGALVTYATVRAFARERIILSQ